MSRVDEFSGISMSPASPKAPASCSKRQLQQCSRLGNGNIPDTIRTAARRLAEVCAPRIVVQLADNSRIVRITIGDRRSAQLAAPCDIVGSENLAVVVVI